MSFLSNLIACIYIYIYTYIVFVWVVTGSKTKTVVVTTTRCTSSFSASSNNLEHAPVPPLVPPLAHRLLHPALAQPVPSVLAPSGTKRPFVDPVAARASEGSNETPRKAEPAHPVVPPCWPGRENGLREGDMLYWSICLERVR